MKISFIRPLLLASSLLGLSTGFAENKVPFDEVKSVPYPYGPEKIQLRRMVWLKEIKKPEALSPHYDPTPITNNLQLYPFRLSVPMEGVGTLPPRTFSFYSRHTFLDGKHFESNKTHRVDIDQWYLEQTIGIKVGLPKHWQLQVQVPLYHYKGDSSYTQNGIELMGLGKNSRHFWGGPTINLKHPFAYFHDEDLYLSYSFWFQFPETNTRDQGGTSSGHWAINGISMKKWGEKTLHFNIGYENAGNLKMSNRQILDQGFGVFSALGYSQPYKKNTKWEAQLHLSQNVSDGIDDTNDFNVYGSFGVNHSHDHHRLAVSLIAGVENMPTFGLTVETQYTW